jgi:hypothetical protein
MERKKTAHAMRAVLVGGVPRCDETPSEARRLRAGAQGRFRGERRRRRRRRRPTEAEAEAEAEPEPDPEPDPEPEPEPGPEPEPEPEPEAETETETESEAETETETETEAETETETETEPEPEAETETEPEPETETESEAESEAESETESETESEAESEAETESETESESEPESGRLHQGRQERVFVGQVIAQVAQHDRQGQHCRIVGEAGGQVGVVVAMAIGRAEERQVIVLEGLVIGEGLAQAADLGGQGGGADLAGVDGRQERVAAVEEPAQVGVLGRQLRHHG